MGRERRAAVEAVDRHLDSVLTYADRVTGVTADAVGVVQEVFVDAICEARAEGESSAETARRLLASARAASLDAVRRRRREGPPTDAGAAGPVGDARVEPPNDDELEASLRAANLELPVAQREVLALRHAESMAYDAIADLMSLSPFTAAQLSWRACGRLRSLRGQRGDVKLDSLACDRALSLMTLAEDGPLPGAAQRWLDHHLADCRRCPASARAIADTRATYRRWRRLRAAYYLREQLLDGVEQAFAAEYAHASVRTRARRRARRAAPAPGAGALLLAVAATGAVMHLMPLKSGDGESGDSGEAPPLPFASLSVLPPGAQAGRDPRDERGAARRARRRSSDPRDETSAARRRRLDPDAIVGPPNDDADPDDNADPPDDDPDPRNPRPRWRVISVPREVIPEGPAVVVRRRPPPKRPRPKPPVHPPDEPREPKPPKVVHVEPPKVVHVKPPKQPRPKPPHPPRGRRPKEAPKHGPIPPGHHHHSKDNRPHGKHAR